MNKTVRAQLIALGYAVLLVAILWVVPILYPIENAWYLIAVLPAIIGIAVGMICGRQGLTFIVFALAIIFVLIAAAFGVSWTDIRDSGGVSAIFIVSGELGVFAGWYMRFRMKKADPEAAKKRGRLYIKSIKWGTVGLVIAVIIAITLVPFAPRRKLKYEHAWNNARTFPREFLGMAKTYKKKDFANLGYTFPVGNDPEVLNNGKYCGLYYEVTDAGERITLIGVAQAGRDYRSSSDPDSPTGSYIPSIRNGDQIEYLPEITFERESWVWWYALMKYYDDGTQKIPYDREYSREHFALVVFPAVKNERLSTFIMNENGIIYEKEFDDPGYIDTYPGPDPVALGWEISY